MRASRPTFQALLQGGGRISWPVIFGCPGRKPEPTVVSHEHFIGW